MTKKLKVPKYKEKMKSSTKVLISIGIIILVVVILIFGLFVYDTTKVECGYEVQQYKGCDSDPDCECTHKSWGGLGSCDTCRCYVCR